MQTQPQLSAENVTLFSQFSPAKTGTQNPQKIAGTVEELTAALTIANANGRTAAAAAAKEFETEERQQRARQLQRLALQEEQRQLEHDRRYLTGDEPNLSSDTRAYAKLKHRPLINAIRRFWTRRNVSEAERHVTITTAAALLAEEQFHVLPEHLISAFEDETRRPWEDQVNGLRSFAIHAARREPRPKRIPDQPVDPDADDSWRANIPLVRSRKEQRDGDLYWAAVSADAEQAGDRLVWRFACRHIGDAKYRRLFDADLYTLISIRDEAARQNAIREALAAGYQSLVDEGWAVDRDVLRHGSPLAGTVRRYIAAAEAERAGGRLWPRASREPGEDDC